MHAALDNRLRARLRLRHIELLDVLADTLNIHHAAPRMHLSQPAVSKLLQEAEAIYGTRLFDRMPRGLRATAAGLVATRWARLLLQQLGESVSETHLVAAGATGRVRIGVLSVAIPTLLSPVLQRLRHEMPLLTVTLIEGDMERLLVALGRHELDMVMGRLTPSLDKSLFASEILYDEPVQLVVRRGHPLLRKKSLDLEDLVDSTWMLPPEQAPFRKQLDQMFFDKGLPHPVTRVETTSLLLLETALTQTDMVAAMPRSVARLYEERGRIGLLRMKIPITMPPVGVVLNARSGCSPATDAVVRVVRQIANIVGGSPYTRQS